MSYADFVEKQEREIFLDRREQALERVKGIEPSYAAWEAEYEGSLPDPPNRRPTGASEIGGIHVRDKVEYLVRRQPGGGGVRLDSLHAGGRIDAVGPHAVLGLDDVRMLPRDVGEVRFAYLLRLASGGFDLLQRDLA